MQTITKISTEYDGKPRTLYKKECGCGNSFWTPKHRLDRIYCSIKCSSKIREISIEATCAQCGNSIRRTPSKLLRSKHKRYFCNRKCKELGQSAIGNCKEIRPKHYKDGNSKYRKHLEEKCGCGESRIFLLMIHHKDGNHKDNRISNLETVCANCHIMRHLKQIDGKWLHCTKSLTPRELLKGLGTAWGGHLACTEKIQ